MGFRIKGRALLCSLIPLFFCVPLSSQLLGSSLPLCFVNPTSIMTLSLPVAAGLILQAGYGGLVYEVDRHPLQQAEEVNGDVMVAGYNDTMLLLKVTKHAYDSVFFSFFSVL